VWESPGSTAKGAFDILSKLIAYLLVTAFAILNFCLAALPIAPTQEKPVREGLVRGSPETLGLLPSRLGHIDTAVGTAIETGEIPGAVVLVARHGRIAYFRAFGNRSVQPEREPMTLDTIFDVSSLTKVVATTPSIMLLVESGTLRLADKVRRYLPEFSGGGKNAITVSQLLTHYSGLPADFNLSRQWFGHPAALKELWKVRTVSKPGKEFLYSDINFIALGEIVHAVSGKTLDAFAVERIFVPLDMTDTLFCPPETMKERIAPTESRRHTLRYLRAKSSQKSLDRMLRGEVHDPTAFRMEGVAGHAGLFSSARDLAVYAQMLLDEGMYKGKQLLSPLSVRAMTRPQSPFGSPDVRGYGWDLESGYSSPRGDIFEEGYGHSGFTGTSLWIHPPTDSFVILLSNRVHPNGGKDINHLRAAIANIVASSITDPPEQ
jgi:CubicO group peptidase (beta-lactamase class C family)